MILNKNNIRIAIPNKGRLREPIIELLKRAGLSFRVKERALYAKCSSLDNIDFIFVRADDIPVLVDAGAADIGFTGEDLIEERGANVSKVLSLGIGRCRLCLAAPELNNHKELNSFAGKLIATSFPHITKEYFKKKDIKVKTLEMNGSVEIMTALGMADAIVDIVETGDSLQANKLEVAYEIGKYQTVMISRLGFESDERCLMIKKRINGILIADRYSLLEYNISESSLKKAEEITPGFDSPTISRLDGGNGFAVKVMVEKKKVPDILDQLERCGATAILETEIKNCRIGNLIK